MLFRGLFRKVAKIMFKYRIPLFLQILGPSYTWKVDTNDKVLYFTFDDGPHPEVTRWVLNELNKFNAKATFFCVGENVSKFPEIYRDILSNGHSTGNHTFNHLKGWQTANDEYFSNTQKAAEFIQGNLFRPPYGRIKPSQAKELKKNYKLVMWSHLSCDYEKNLNLKNSLNEMKKAGPGAIFVFHDSIKSYHNLKVLLPELLQFYSNLGYRFDVIPQK
jgi:peptidoglycan/xylan/chitin deacetylase (PgdA/CDA1 family)